MRKSEGTADRRPPAKTNIGPNGSFRSSGLKCMPVKSRKHCKAHGAAYVSGGSAESSLHSHRRSVKPAQLRPWCSRQLKGSLREALRGRGPQCLRRLQRIQGGAGGDASPSSAFAPPGSSLINWNLSARPLRPHTREDGRPSPPKASPISGSPERVDRGRSPPHPARSPTQQTIKRWKRKSGNRRVNRNPCRGPLSYERCRI